MSASVARRVGDKGLALRERLLRQSGQRIELAQDADDRLALPIAGNKRSGLVGHAGLDREARVFKLDLEQR